MKALTIFLLNNNINENYEEIDFIKYNNESFINDLYNCRSKYITFIKNYDNISNNYFELITKKITEDFDSCFLNYTIEIDNKVLSTEILDEPEINQKPYSGDYIWAYIFKKEKLIDAINSPDNSKEFIDKTFVNVTHIKETLYNHIPSEKIINDFIYNDEKNIERYKNVFYMGTYCNGQFNGYISWLNNIGRCFSNDYKMTIIYDKIYGPTKDRFSRYFDVFERREDTLYVCDRLFLTYSTYYYPKNILKLEENYMFIHGNMSDYENIRKYKYDNYTKYIGVSEISAKKAHGYFPTDTILHIFNPIKIDYSEVKPHLKLVSAQRYDPIKRSDRLLIISKILDEENIPYTWNVFTDQCPYEKNVIGGLIYRQSVVNPLPYINDADYYVQLSDSEACCYSVLEAISLNTKVIVTPLECYDEMNLDDNIKVTIPFEYFNPDNKENLRKLLIDIYNDKDKTTNYKLNTDLFKGYLDLLKK